MTEKGNQASPGQELVPENSAFPPGYVTHKRSESLPSVGRERCKAEGEGEVRTGPPANRTP